MNFGQTFSTCILILSVNCFLGACATPKKQAAPSEEMIHKISTLESEIQDLKTQNAILKKKPAVAGSPVAEKPLEVSSEHSVYSASLDAYWAKDLPKLERVSAMFLKAFPKSVHADNVLYNLGLLQMSMNSSVLSLQTLNRLIKEYPDSSKVVSAEYLKAQVYASMNLQEQSDELLRKIVKTYPGSLEASRIKKSFKEVSKR